jgi:carbon monoxide dehydrogenase subunit G
VAEAEYTTTTRVPIDAVWAFVQEMDNWGRFVTGYQKHEKQDDKHSTWTLRGDVGVLSRTLTFAVEIVEWNGPSRVSFTLKGVNEPMQGEGTFTLTTESESDSGSGSGSDSDSAAQLDVRAGSGGPSEDGLSGGRRTDPQTPPGNQPGEPRQSSLFRLLQSFWRWLLGRAGGGAPQRDASAALPAAAGETLTRLRFALKLQPGGPMAPMVDAMIRPLMLPAAEDLANRILAQLESDRAS